MKWTYKKNEVTHDYTVFNDSFAVAIVFPTMRTGTTFDHDVKKITAAPELLEACKKAMDECCDLVATPAGNAIKAAIHKAECDADEGEI